MTYDPIFISNLSQDIDTYEVFLRSGHGTQENNFVDGEVIAVYKCSELDVWILTESANISKHGIISKRNSFEESIITYRKK